MSDKLEEIFQMQQALNKRIGVETAGMTEEEKIKWVLNYLRAMQQEMAELHRTFQAAYPGRKGFAMSGTPRASSAPVS